ncbi:peptide ABC transporter substrate-binding protein [Gardnerella swidsinskii]|jgi:ABC-type oligopeptide transporter, periplasmic component|uniref:ABC transporter substrate-binding protein n=1 Tax=Gardnerella swidsinskii TaxID=2792979 RepID=A0A9X7FEZ9_9BIFI|nr:ABC transporter substrate-binding protein [Gardnerella swidsinskii]APW18485.1 ABC transporter substrate-binding protein [Gardnerella vaginalis]EFH71646.1 ABC-type oligopeptide transporter, periplasmic component [Gardnerella vaginalis 5-1]MDK6295314.1 ABC transporter substrate-binding protein [Gardnerella swidsinskii]NSX39529.1 ABC transporter substrate-binding protein [Gardnerella vaginalis]NSX40699.1 ABC transporter substrate-binding protein [Gardnerella vaginalis]
MKNKALAFAAAACSLAMLLGGCGSSAKNAQTNGGKVIITVSNSEPQNELVPGNINENAGARPAMLVNSTLVTFDEKGNPVNEDAESITPNADATQYTVKVKKGKKFSDGTPITAESFVKAWSFVANAKNAQKCASFFQTIKGYADLQKDGTKGDEQLSGLKVVDENTFTVDLEQPDSVFPIKVGYLAFAPLPESFYKDPKAYGEKPVSSGPYLFKSWDHNKQIEVVKNPDYDGPRKAQNDGVTFKVYTDGNAAYRDVQAGNLDMTDNIPDTQTKTFQKDTTVKAYNRPGSVIQQFTIPSSLPHFDVKTEEGKLRRQAISMAIDRKVIINKILNGTASPANEFTSPLTPGYKADLKGHENVEFNAKKAKELWAKADKISKYDGSLTFSYNADGNAKSVFDAVVNSLKNNLGIKAETTPIPTFQEFRNACAKRQIKGAWRAGWMPDYPSAENYLTQEFASVAADGNGSNEGDYKNPKFDDLLKKAASAKPEEAIKLYQQANEILLEDLPSVPLFYSNAKAVMVPTLKGFTMDWQNMPLYYQLHK